MPAPRRPGTRAGAARRRCGPPAGARGGRRTRRGGSTRPASQVAEHGPAGERVVDVPAHGGQCTRRRHGARTPRPRPSARRCVRARPTPRVDRPVDACVYSRRYIEPIYRTALEPESDHARARHPRTAQGAAAPRLRAEEAPRRDARLPVGRLVRLALSGAAPARARRRDRESSTPTPPAGARSRPPARSTATSRPRAPAPPPAKPSRRTRKAYRHHRRAATPASSSCCSPTTPRGDDERTFALKLAFCRHLDARARLELLERRRRAALAERPRAAPAASTPGRGDRYTPLAVRAPHPSPPQRDLEWVDALDRRRRPRRRSPQPDASNP